MAVIAPHAPETTRPKAVPLVGAGLASLGAGAIHAAAVGVHSEHRPAALAFTGLAAAQLAWGAVALTRGGRALVAVGIAVQAAAVGGWLLAKTAGIGFIAGLDAAESVQLADGIAVALAATALAFGIVRLVDSAVPRVGSATRGVPGGAWARGAFGTAVVLVSLTAMVAAGSHAHTGAEHGAAHDDGTADEVAAGAAHDHGADATGDHSDMEGMEGMEDMAAPVVAPTPYDPEMPIDLGGVEGVTPQQQAAAENLVAITLARLPQFADPQAAEAAGYFSIGDGVTGREHLIKWDLLSDGRILDPDYPESLVYDTSGGGRRLVSAMFMLEPGASLDDVPELGGALTQWHIHDNLCFTPGDNPRVAGLTQGDGSCPAPLQKLTPVPMIHVWIEPHECGPFSALEGVAAGQVAEGEEQLCDHAHGG